MFNSSDNGPTTNDIFNSTPSDFKTFNARLNTYRNWPNARISTTNLANAGFVYTGQDDIVICPFCQVEGFRWEVEDNPLEDHMKWNFHCPFLSNNAESDYSQSTTNNQDTCGLYGVEILTNSFPVDLQGLGIQKSKTGPRYPDKTNLERRLETLQMWPRGIKQRPAELAEAGFFYTGMGDQTLCFYCGGGLEDWEEKDDPWELHALWFSKCTFVNLKKGAEFVTKVKHRNQQQTYLKEISNTETEKKPVASTDALSRKNSLREEHSGGQSMCKICFKNDLGVIFLPCGHIVACVDCSVALKTCAVCRKSIGATARAFLS